MTSGVAAVAHSHWLSAPSGYFRILIQQGRRTALSLLRATAWCCASGEGASVRFLRRRREPLLRLGILGKDSLQLLRRGLGTDAELLGIAVVFIVFK